MSKLNKNDFLHQLEEDYQKHLGNNRERKRINKSTFVFTMLRYIVINNLIVQFTVMIALLTIFSLSYYYPTGNYLLTSQFIKLMCCSAIVMVASSFLFLGKSFKYGQMEIEKTTFFSKKSLLKVHFTIALFINSLMLVGIFLFFTYLRIVPIGEISFYFIVSIEITFLMSMVTFQKSQHHPIDWSLYLCSLTIVLSVLVLTMPNTWIKGIYDNTSPIYLVIMFVGCIYISTQTLITD